MTVTPHLSGAQDSLCRTVVRSGAENKEVGRDLRASKEQQTVKVVTGMLGARV